MPKDTNNKTKKDNEKLKKGKKSVDVAVIADVIDIDEVEDDNAIAAELDPEVLKALNATKKKKKPNFDDIDYIPELERGDLDIDSGLSSND